MFSRLYRAVARKLGIQIETPIETLEDSIRAGNGLPPGWKVDSFSFGHNAGTAVVTSSWQGTAIEVTQPADTPLGPQLPLQRLPRIPLPTYDLVDDSYMGHPQP